MLLRLKPYTPRKPEIFWCAHCDNEKVDSTNTDTGRFFVQFGHAFDDATQHYDGDYHGVMFAVCKSCHIL